MKKVFFVIPGFRMKASDSMFRWLTRYLEQLNHKVVGVPVKWNYHTLTKNAEEFEGFFSKNKGKENYILGFSYGAVLAFITANKLKPKKIYLCSLSPDFDEDRVYMKKWERNYIGKRRYEDTKTRRAKKLAKELIVPSVVFYGEEEGRKYPEMGIRAKETVRLAKNSKLIMVKGSKHDIANPEYQKAIKSAIKP
jgi:hypothetical protein